MTNLAYIMSPSYSGSTLLTFLLAAHPRIGTMGELAATARGDVDKYYCSCGELNRQCAFWQRVGGELARKGVLFDIADFGTDFRCASSKFADRMIRADIRGSAFEMLRKIGLKVLPVARRQFQKILDKNRAIIDTILKLQQADVFLDGSKDPVRLKYLWESGYWNVKAIFLIRDGRGASNSYMKHYGVDMKTAATEWKGCNEEAEKVLRGLDKSQWIKVHYEELCRDTEKMLGHMFEFLGLNPSKRIQNFRSVENHIFGNAMRLDTTSQIRLDERWRDELTEHDLRVFDNVAGKTNRRYGYE